MTNSCNNSDTSCANFNLVLQQHGFTDLQGKTMTGPGSDRNLGNSDNHNLTFENVIQRTFYPLLKYIFYWTLPGEKKG